MDQLQPPRSFPDPHTQYTLKEMTVVWHLFGGRDFSTPQSPHAAGGRGRGKDPEGARRRTGLRCWEKRRDVCLHGCAWKTGGGSGRDHTVLVEVELDKVTRGAGLGM